MTTHTQRIETLETIVAQTLSVIEMMEQIPHMGDAALTAYKNGCLKIPGQIQSGLIKIAVVGVIKSGKSTFINSLVKKELVKRGAGVITAITTRIRKGKKNEAILQLRSWDEINHLIRATLDLFPDNGQGAGLGDQFDLRRKKDRDYLGQVYDRLVKEFPVTSSGIRPEALLIRNALGGYEACKDIVGADQGTLVFSSKAFENHKTFTSDPARAFYVKDVCLNLFGKLIDSNIELADCQGADSTDPAQLNQIVNYIESANLIVYCISSRIGLRQSDMAFLKIIQRLGLLENIVFINNCDLTEHENLADLVQIESKIRQELVFLTPDPRIYSFSALYNLFSAMGSRLSPKDGIRFNLWQEDEQMVGYCNDSHQAFQQMLDHLLEKKHYDLLLSNHLERIRIMADGLGKKTQLFTQVLCSEMDGEKKTKIQLGELQENASRLKSIVDNSIEGAVSGLTKEIQSNLIKAFAGDSINIGKQVRKFVHQTAIDPRPYRSQLKEAGFRQILYLMFQDFKRKLDLFALEQILPEVKKLIEIQENRIHGYFQSLLTSYQIDFLKLGGHLGSEPHFFSEQLGKKDSRAMAAVDIPAIKKILGLKLPEVLFTARYTTKMRANALTGLGFQSAIALISSLLDKHTRFSFTPGFNRAAALIKKQTLVSIQSQTDLYHERVNTLYFMPLIDAVTRDFKDKIYQRFALYDAFNADMEHLFSLNQKEKQSQKDKVQIIQEKIHKIINDLNEFSLDYPS
ncbi:MAG: dynamin family protein [Proteobacteria bacterium]|nr:dynamin family protein [Desulfobacula sp.]MBU4133564.1 dynamin family protein [Pseudomonadota bacterium]